MKKKTYQSALYFFSVVVAVGLTSPLTHAVPKWKKVTSSSGGSTLQGGFMEFSKDSTWVVPAGVTKIQVLIIGGGGGGGNPLSYPAGGGGGGGSCIKRSSTELASANGGIGGKQDNSIPPGPGVKTSLALTVTPAETLNIYVGGGGGAAGWVRRRVQRRCVRRVPTRGGHVP